MTDRTPLPLPRDAATAGRPLAARPVAVNPAIGPSRRRVLLGGAALFGTGVVAGTAGALGWAAQSSVFRDWMRRRGRAALSALAAEVIPVAGVVLPVSFGDSVWRLVQGGAIVPAKLDRLYAARGGLPRWARTLLSEGSADPIRVSAETAPVLLDLLWPLGLANRAAFNERSPLNGPGLGRFASTGGWTLGTRPGGELFNTVEAVHLDAARERVVVAAARKSFRPCCDNSAFFQDCNHGSALLGLYQLAAAQGASSADLFRIGKLANSYWYPQHYLAAAIYFRRVEELGWTEVDPARLMGRRYSSASGWRRNIDARLRAVGLRPANDSSAGGCAI